jgi:hypothetical protein
MMVWDYEHSFGTGVQIFVYASNIVALQVYLDTDVVTATKIVALAISLTVGCTFLIRGTLNSSIDI